jgi:hypothetical protein
MKGSIRVFLGLLLVAGVAGGIDNATDGELLILIPFALAGFALMLSGSNAMKDNA